MKKKKENRNIEILQHNISYYYNHDQEMPEHEEQHVRDMIIEGYSGGELNDSNDKTENYGWWRIVKS